MKHFIITAALLISAQVGLGQTLKTYSGLYNGGKATYTYYEDAEGERIKQGKYTFSKRDNYGLSYYATGLYKNNLKDGEWTYKGGVLGKSTTVINYAEGNMDGTVSRTTVYKDGTSETERYRMKGNFVTGAVKVKEEETLFGGKAWSASGQFDDDGFPDGTWTKNYEKDGNLFVDTEIYVHGLLVAKRTKNESTGEITRSKFRLDPQCFIDAYTPDKDTVVVDGFICKQEIRFAEGEDNHYLEGTPAGDLNRYAFASGDWQRIPNIIGGIVRGFAFTAKGEKGYGLEQSAYQGIPYKEIVIVGEIEKEPEESPTEGEVFTMVEQMPQFPGGQEALDKYLKENIQYSAAAQKGRVMVQFVVNKDGSVSDATIIRSLAPACDEEALRLINAMPNWEPGKTGGKNVRVRYTLPVVFSQD